MYNFSNEAKIRVLSGKVTRGYLKVLATDTKPEMIIDESNYLKNVKLEELRYVPDEGFIGGTVAKRVTGNFNNIDNSFSIQDREFELYLGVDLEDGSTEYIKYGTFIVQKPEDNQVNDNTSFTALDYMVKFNLPWEVRVQFPCKLRKLFLDLIDQVGIKTNVEHFTNEDFIVSNNPFTEGTTRREVLKAIVQVAFTWARVNEDDELAMDFEIKDTVDETFGIDTYYDFSKQDEYGPVNVIVMRNSQVEGENVTLKNDELIGRAIGINRFDVTRLNSETDKLTISRQNELTGSFTVTANGAWATDIIKDTNFLLNLKPSTTYKCIADVTLLDKPNTINDTINHNVLLKLYKTGSEINMLTTIDKAEKTNWTINDKKTLTTQFTTPADLTDYKVLFYTYYVDTTSIGQGSFRFDNIRIIETTELDTVFEPVVHTGENELVIVDNPLAYSQSKRAELIKAGEKLFGLRFIPMSMKMIGYMYLNCTDKIRVTNLNNQNFDTYLIDHTIEYEGTISDSMEAKALTKTETKYQYTTPQEAAIKRTEIIVDKANQTITEVVEKQTDFSNELTKQETSLSGISQQVSKIYDFKKSVKGIDEIVLEDALPTNILKFEAIVKNVVGMYPRKTLYPSPKLYPKKGGTTLTLVFGRTSRGSIPDPILPKKTLYPSSTLYPRADGSYIREYSFYIANPLREYLGKHDIFRVENDTEKGITVVKVIRYVKYENGQYSLYDEPIEEIIDDTQQLQLFKGNNFVYIKEFTDWDISADYIFNNELNKQYAPRVETNANIKTLNNEIELKVSEKVGKDEVITAINLTPEKAKIKSKNLELEGITTINGGFSIDEKGNASIANDTVKINEKGIQLADGASLVGGEGLITNLQFYGKVTHVYGAMNTEGYYDALGFEVDELTTGACVATLCTISADLPKNFTVVSAYVTIKHYPTKFYFNNNHGWGYSRKLKLYQRSSSSMYREYNIFGGALIPSNYGTEVPNAFGKESFTPSIPNDTSQQVDIVTSIDLTEYLSSETNYQSDFIIRSSDTPPAYTGDQSTGIDYVNCGYKTGMVMAVLNVYGYLRLENKEE